jgi:hypothetical protein
VDAPLKWVKVLVAGAANVSAVLLCHAVDEQRSTSQWQKPCDVESAPAQSARGLLALEAFKSTRPSRRDFAAWSGLGALQGRTPGPEPLIGFTSVQLLVLLVPYCSCRANVSSNCSLEPSPLPNSGADRLASCEPSRVSGLLPCQALSAGRSRACRQPLGPSQSLWHAGLPVCFSLRSCRSSVASRVIGSVLPPRRCRGYLWSWYLAF